MTHDALAAGRSTERTPAAVGARSRRNVIVSTCWALNICLLLVGIGWVYLFGESRESIQLMQAAVLKDSPAGILIRDPSRLGFGVAAGLMGTAAALSTGVVMLTSLFVGGERFRTLRMWLLFMATACAWLGLVVSWPTIYWFGQQQRVRRIVPAAEVMVRSLERDWPKEDSELPAIGPFLAYPGGAPTALLPLRDAKFPNTSQRFSAVERTGDNVMRFELSGAESGAWLEWRGDRGEPQSFTGGLATKYEVERRAQLAPGWFLVRYRAIGLAN